MAFSSNVYRTLFKIMSTVPIAFDGSAGCGLLAECHLLAQSLEFSSRLQMAFS